MKGNVFSQWLKEFCALVFTQTVQAFLLAIVLLIVVIAISNGNEANNTVNVTAGGVLAIIALTSISKIEDLIKKLFGLNSSITDTSMRGGRHGLLGTYAALKMSKKALDNLPKLGKGISGSFKAGTQKRQAAIEATNKLRKLDSRYGMGGYSSTTPTTTGTAKATSSPVLNSAQERLDELKAEGFGPGDREYDSALADLNTAKSKIAQANSSSNGKNFNEKYEDKKEKIMEEYNKKIAEAKKLGKDSRKEIFSGITETVGAGLGGVAGASIGAIVAAGTGESDILQHATKGLGTGIGVGDIIGKGAVDAAYTPSNISNAVSNYTKTLKKYRNDENKKLIEAFEQEMKKFNAGDI